MFKSGQTYYGECTYADLSDITDPLSWSLVLYAVLKCTPHHIPVKVNSVALRQPSWSLRVFLHPMETQPAFIWEHRVCAMK
jgi:hypothetical protein